ncbi:N-(5'-phosphoribosyl)anthranilate isomerase [Halioglobus sp. HI00S01]|uniref:phosphoribosylanthranilate isomerase n=1 Tax=Halioglobus sp. HI00S01 TaxID=1822214 RepID=UPI0007C22199|nr:phosphoribosylanthranilate isomerase [Halioglobus sp. HI00S01]KZX60149.1 N-(5'-phosphoribosyl)anthranilate isomerase [Halioglobus sp. HI00S01]
MSRTRIKVCGITRPEDARVAVASGADALGLVFYAESPRGVSLEQAQAVAREVPPFVTLVGLFVNHDAEFVARCAAELPLGLLQFHGDESPAFCRQFERPWIKALRVRPDSDIAAYCDAYAGALGILLDAWKDGVPGGTGESFDWDLIGSGLSLPVVLAGGLNPANVGQAITTVRPFAVDVSGGVEAAPGEKDPVKIREFIAAAQAVDHIEQT